MFCFKMTFLFLSLLFFFNTLLTIKFVRHGGNAINCVMTSIATQELINGNFKKKYKYYGAKSHQ